MDADPDVPEPTDFRSIKMVDYDFEFTPQKIPPTRVRSHTHSLLVYFCVYMFYVCARKCVLGDAVGVLLQF